MEYPHNTPWRRFRARLLDADRSAKRAVLVAWDAFVAAGALWLALYLRFGSTTYPHDERYGALYILLPLLVVGTMWVLGMYRLLVRSMDTSVAVVVVAGAALGSVFLMVWDYYEPVMFIPRSVPFLYLLLTVTGVGAARITLKLAYQILVPRGPSRRRVALVGGGNAGVELATAMRSARGYRVVAMFDTSGELARSTIGSVRVQPFDNMGELVRQLDVQEVLVADRNTLAEQGDAFARLVSETGVQVRLAPSMADVLSDDTRHLQTRKVRIEDLVGRDVRPPIPGLIENSLKGRTVLVTGAAGSIGSEICRQVVKSGAEQLVAFDSSEYGLYQLDQSLRSDLPASTRLHIRLGSVTDPLRVRAIISELSPSLVYHAAAYKHVPLVEANVLAGVRNNVIGTQVIAQTALDAGVDRFVLISTDKAVRPTNVMGATKRVAELVVQDLQRHAERDGGGTVFSMVRFGNVLGSSGSVVPLFEKQIARGGPVTLTNRNVTRYFMTISEAAELVLQAGFLAQGGEVFVLDMGEPVRLHDLARMMIQLSGHRVRSSSNDAGIEIVETGLRPGEKMYEELLIGADVVGTDHPKIMRAMERHLTSEEMADLLDQLRMALDSDDTEHAIILLKQHGDLTPSSTTATQ